MMNRIILIIAVWMLAASVAVAQEATVKRVEFNPLDLSGKKYQRLDLNGDPCALVKVEVLANDVEFTGNVIEPVEHRTGEYWVYMVQGSKMLRINSGSFLPLMINFPDYGIKDLEPSLTYIVTLSAPYAVTAQQPAEDSSTEGVDYTSFSENDKWGYKDKNGKIVIPAKYDFAYNFSEGLAAVEINGKYGFINHKGDMVIQPKYDSTYKFYKGFATVKVNDRYGLINKAGKTVLPVKYDWIYFTEGMGRVKLDGKYGFIDSSGYFVVPLQYEEAGLFSEGLAGVRKGDKCGYINKTGTMVIPARYSSVSDFCDGKAAVTYKGKIGFIDANDNFEPCRIGSDEITVTGKLTDENGDELIGGIISVPSTENKGSATDIDGNYRITVKYGTPLIFSYVGFRTKIVLATTNRIDVALVEGM